MLFLLLALFLSFSLLSLSLSLLSLLSLSLLSLLSLSLLFPSLLLIAGELGGARGPRRLPRPPV
jgi:hypothetical protein